MEPRTFFSVSLINNLATLQKSIPIILRIYPDATYYLICRENDSTYFVENLPNHERLVVLSEHSLMTYEKFLAVYNKIKSFQSSENSIKRLPWYYQQALKIIFVLKSSILFQDTEIRREVHLNTPAVRHSSIYDNAWESFEKVRLESEKIMLTLREHIKRPTEAHTPVEGELIARIEYLENMLSQCSEGLRQAESDRDNLRFEKLEWTRRLF